MLRFEKVTQITLITQISQITQITQITQIAQNTWVRRQMMFCRFLDKCQTVFPLKNRLGCYTMATEKVHSMKQNTPNDVARFCDYINSSAEAAEKGTKNGLNNKD